MPFVSRRTGRAAVAAMAVLACSEPSSPTQPRSASPDVRVQAPRANGDVTPATLPSTIDACYVLGKGSIYRVNADGLPAACDKKDVAFSWAAQSVMTGLTFHSASVTLPEDGRSRVMCEDGKSLVNFGWEIPANSTATASQIKGNRPAFSAGKVFWAFQASPGTVYVFYWTCANADPAALAQ